MAHYISYSDRLERQARNRRRLLKFLILVACYFTLTHFVVRLYRVQDNLSREISMGSYVVVTFYYPFFSNPPTTGDVVLVSTFATAFWSWGCLGEAFTLGLIKDSQWGRESLNLKRLYKIIAKAGDVLRFVDGTTLAVRTLGRFDEVFYTLPEGSPPLFSLEKFSEYVLKEGQYLGLLTGASASEAVNALRRFDYGDILSKARFHFKL